MSGASWCACVYGFNHRRHIRDDPRNVQDCMQGRIRLMTALTPASAHAFPEHIRILAAKADYRQLPNVRTMTRLTGAGFGGWSIFANGGTHKIVVGWRAVRSLTPEVSVTSCSDQSLLMKHMKHVLPRVSKPTTLLRSVASSKHFSSS